MVVLWWALMSGCAVDDAPDDACIVVQPQSISFADVDLGEDPALTEVITISNQCGDGDGDDLDLTEVTIEDAGAPFELGSPAAGVASGASTELTVTFDPADTGVFITSIHIHSNDPLHEVVEVAVTGTAVAAALTLTPEEGELEAFVGCWDELPLTIGNTGSAPLVVEALTLVDAPEFFIEWDDDLTTEEGVLFTVDVGESADATLVYSPTDVGEHAGLLNITSSDRELHTGAFTGSAEVFGTQVDTFEVEASTPVDIVLAVDASPSMQGEVGDLHDEAGALLAGLETSDYQLTAWVADDGCPLGELPRIDGDLSAAEASDALEVLLDLPTAGEHAGSYSNKLFTIVERGLAKTDGGCNDGLLREGARLAIVAISDAPEDSVNSYVYHVEDAASYVEDVVFHAIAGDYPSGCGSAEAGVGYYEASVATGGLFLSICSTDWEDTLSMLAADLATSNGTFVLSEEPVRASVVVEVDGSSVTSGWMLSGNAVVFEADGVPAVGSEVVVRYDILPDC